MLERQCDELRKGGGVLASASAPAPGGSRGAAPAPGGSASASAPAPGGSSGEAPAPGGRLGARASIISSDEVDGVEEALRWDDAAQCHDEEMARRQKDAHDAHMMDVELNEIVETQQQWALEEQVDLFERQEAECFVRRSLRRQRRAEKMHRWHGSMPSSCDESEVSDTTSDSSVALAGAPLDPGMRPYAPPQTADAATQTTITALAPGPAIAARATSAARPRSPSPTLR